MQELTDFITNEYNLRLLIPAAIIILLVVIALVLRARRSPADKTVSAIRRGRVLSKEEFLEEWAGDKSDFPGCYVILAYKRRIVKNHMRYNELYVGQSVNVRKRVHSHLSGRGNGEVYHLLRDGYHLYVAITKVNPKKLNKTEKELISRLSATESINMTSGGATKVK